MGVYIKGMEMPKKGSIEIRIYPDGRVIHDPIYACKRVVGRAVPVPPHGRLEDLDKLADNMRSATAGMEHRAIIMHEIRRAPTIIDAEKVET